MVLPLPKEVIFDGEELSDVLLGKSKRSRKNRLFSDAPPTAIPSLSEKLARPRGEIRQVEITL